MAVTDTNTQLGDEDRQVSLSDQIAAEFERRHSGSNESGETETLDPAAGVDGESDPATPPAADGGDEGAGEGAVTEVTAGDGTPPAEGEGEGGEVTGEGDSQDGIPDLIPQPPPPSQFSMDEYARQLYGRPLTEQETATLFAWQQQFSSLGQDQLSAIEQIVAGQTPAPPTSDDDDGETDPYVQQQIRAALGPIQEQVGQLSQYVETEAQRNARQERDRVAGMIEEGKSAFQTRYELSDEEVAALEQRVVQSQTFPGLYNAFQGNANEAMQSALDQALWTTPELRDRMIQAQVDKSRSQDEVDATRKRKASSLSGGGGAVSRETPPPATQTGRQAAMAAELTELMNGSGSQQ